MKARSRIQVQGRVQGVGFRPTAYRYALDNKLAGWISNTSEGVIIEVEGEKPRIEAFILKLESNPPPLARITSIQSHYISVTGEKDFEILPSLENSEIKTQISPDISICDDCLREMFDRKNRRFLYPFINCTNCGPRYSIIREIPYDRKTTTMGKFAMCAECRAEYENPLDRRFHAQPDACGKCGPRIWLEQSDGKASRQAMPNESVIDKAGELLEKGKILAIKGLGGFHLACNPFLEKAVKRLRNRKVREDKPFALMAGDIDFVKQLCEVSKAEEVLLKSWKRPIVLIKKKKNADILLADQVAPGNDYLGFMLPYTPLHFLLFSGSIKALVMTSGNISDEPIVFDNNFAKEHLKKIADYYLLHDRDIFIRCDDSVSRVFRGQESLLRRSRGYAPEPIGLKYRFPAEILACGSHLKNTFCIARDNEVALSHHIGDLENWETNQSFSSGVAHLIKLFGVHPEAVACDMHPDYFSTNFAAEYARDNSKKLIKVQHHHAHVVSCMADNDLIPLVPPRRIIGVAFDGTGYGSDGNIWGGEFLLANAAGFERKAHLEYFRLPGGEAAIREPWRTTASILRQVMGKGLESLQIDFVRNLKKEKWTILEKMLETGMNSPQTSSMGRLFDAVSALVGLREEVNYEGQAAIEFEQLANRCPPGKRKSGRYHFSIDCTNNCFSIGYADLFHALSDDILKKMPPELIAAGFHDAVAAMILQVCIKIREETGIREVAFSGGVFQNLLLLKLIESKFKRTDFELFFHGRVPANDGGICLGQAIVASEAMSQDRRGIQQSR